MNKIAVVSMIKNEEDIVESFIRHASLFADKIYIKDHKSSDRTREIIKSLKSEGLPIDVSTFELDEFAMSEVITQLASRAIDDGFDIVIPLDSDEFPILIGGNSEDLRKYLQNLDVTKYYQVYLWNYRFADQSENQYALSRSLVYSKTKVGKVFVGREFWIKHKPIVNQGNHGLTFSDKNSNPPVVADYVFYAHLAERSSDQLISKHAIQWINTMLKSSRYTLQAIHCKAFIHNYVKDKNVANISINGWIPADLSAYKNEASLRFTGGGAENRGYHHSIHICIENYSFWQKISPKLSTESVHWLKSKSFGSFYSSMAM